MSTGMAWCARCMAEHEEGGQMWVCDGCGGTFCWAYAVNGKRVNRDNTKVHLSVTRLNVMRLCGVLTKVPVEQGDVAAVTP